MKKLFLLTIIGFMLASCSDDKAREKALLNEIIKMHDKVMVDDNIIMKNKMQLKPYANATTPIKDSVASYTKLLDNADDEMMTWMNKFNPDFTGKSHDEVMTYLNTQKAQILKLDSQLTSTITASNNYIIKLKTK